jgi:hypothetical protein
MVRSLLIATLLLPLLGGSLLAQNASVPQVPTERAALSETQVEWNKNQASENMPEEKDDRTVGQLLVLGLLAPFLIPYEAFDDNIEENAKFTRYPYRNHYPGFLWVPEQSDDPADAPQTSEPPGCTSWSARAILEDGYDLDRINRMGLRLTVDSEYRFGLTSNWNWYHETFWCGCTYDFLVGDTNLTYRFAQNEKVAFYTGVGCRYFTDGKVGDAGVNVLYGCDIFPVRPVVVSLLVDGGNLGSSAVVHWRATIGATLKGVEMFGGYDFMRIGCIDLEGPLVGLRYWF